MVSSHLISSGISAGLAFCFPSLFPSSKTFVQDSFSASEIYFIYFILLASPKKTKHIT